MRLDTKSWTSVTIWFTNLANCCFRAITINNVITDSQSGSTKREKLLITPLELSLLTIVSDHHRELPPVVLTEY